MEISSTLGRLSKSPSSDYGAGRGRPLELSTSRDFVARSAAVRPKKLASLGKKLMRSTCGKSACWDVSSSSGVFNGRLSCICLFIPFLYFFLFVWWSGNLMTSNAFSSCPGATHTRPCSNLSPSPTCSQVILSWMETKRRKLIGVWLR